MGEDPTHILTTIMCHKELPRVITDILHRFLLHGASRGLRVSVSSACPVGRGRPYRGDSVADIFGVEEVGFALLKS